MSLGENSNLTATEIEIIVDKAVRKTFVTLGADLSDSKSVLALQQDFNYVRQQRVGMEKTAEFVKRSAITTFLAGMLFALWLGIKASLKGTGI